MNGHEAMERLPSLARRIESTAAKLGQLRRERDALLLAAASDGYSEREAGSAGGVSGPRVQQLKLAHPFLNAKH